MVVQVQKNLHGDGWQGKKCIKSGIYPATTVPLLFWWAWCAWLVILTFILLYQYWGLTVRTARNLEQRKVLSHLAKLQHRASCPSLSPWASSAGSAWPGRPPTPPSAAKICRTHFCLPEKQHWRRRNLLREDKIEQKFFFPQQAPRVLKFDVIFCFRTLPSPTY